MRAVQTNDIVSGGQLRNRRAGIHPLLDRRESELDTILQLLRERALPTGRLPSIRSASNVNTQPHKRRGKQQQQQQSIHRIPT